MSATMVCDYCGEEVEWEDNDTTTCCATVYHRVEDAPEVKVYHDSFMGMPTLHLELPDGGTISIADSYKGLVPTSKDVVLLDGEKVDKSDIEIGGDDA